MGFSIRTHGRVAKVTDLQFIGLGSNPASNLKLFKFHKKFLHIYFLVSKTLYNNFWVSKYFLELLAIVILSFIKPNLFRFCSIAALLAICALLFIVANSLIL
jgi:hypothetical protein